MNVAELTGIILTKLDGTARGGVVLAIKNELKIPVKFIGVGEGIDDLQPFNPQAFAQSLFEEMPDKINDDEVLPVYEQPLEYVPVEESEEEKAVKELFREIVDSIEVSGQDGVPADADGQGDTARGAESDDGDTQSV